MVAVGSSPCICVHSSTFFLPLPILDHLNGSSFKRFPHLFNLVHRIALPAGNQGENVLLFETALGKELFAKGFDESLKSRRRALQLCQGINVKSR
jgi:hypothetical protein